MRFGFGRRVYTNYCIFAILFEAKSIRPKSTAFKKEDIDFVRLYIFKFPCVFYRRSTNFYYFNRRWAVFHD